MLSSDQNLVTISLAQWHRSSELLRQRKHKQPDKTWLRHFTYDLQADIISQWDTGEASSLFFEQQSCSGVEITDAYILFELSDGADNVNGSKIHQAFKYQNDPRREIILRRGIFVNDRLYSLIGTSNSGIQAHTFVFRRGSLEENEKLMLSLMPNLRQLESSKGVAKRIKYQGLLFSGAQVISLPDSGVDVHEILSFERARSANGDMKYDFTDGCGLISLRLATYLHRKHSGRTTGSQKKRDSAVPSIFQIRYAGKIKRLNDDVEGYICKGVLLVDHRNNATNVICVRKSMLKEIVSDSCASMLGKKIGIIDYSRESPGKLSQQLICLLTASVPDEVLESIQKQHLDAVDTAPKDPLSVAWLAGLDPRVTSLDAFTRLLLGAARELKPGATHRNQNPSNHNEPIDAGFVVTSNMEVKQDTIQGSSASDGQKAEHTEPIPASYSTCTIGRHRHLSDNQTKVQIPLASCRTYFGAAFPETLGVSRMDYYIEEGECIVMLEDGPLNEETVIVARSPSYHPGDIQVLKNRGAGMTENHPVRHLRNCILFTTDGVRPDAYKMGGGDLDGDRFLVVWDSRLIAYCDEIKRINAPEYDVETSMQSKNLMILRGTKVNANSDWIHSAAMHDSVMLGAIENSLYALAKEFGVNSSEIHQLNQIFSQLIDRKPAAIESFETLCRKAYNRTNNSMNEALPGNRRPVWERMLSRQLELQDKIRENPGPIRNDFCTFELRLRELCDQQVLDSRLKNIQFHFDACIQNSTVKRAFDSFRHLITTNADISVPLESSAFSECRSNAAKFSEFVSGTKTLVIETITKMKPRLLQLQKQQKKLTDFIYHQKALYTKLIEMYESGQSQFGAKCELIEHYDKFALNYGQNLTVPNMRLWTVSET